jgi:hypothetical protein
MNHPPDNSIRFSHFGSVRENYWDKGMTASFSSPGRQKCKICDPQWLVLALFAAPCSMPRQHGPSHCRLRGGRTRDLTCRWTTACAQFRAGVHRSGADAIATPADIRSVSCSETLGQRLLAHFLSSNRSVSSSSCHENGVDVMRNGELPNHRLCCRDVLGR